MRKKQDLLLPLVISRRCLNGPTKKLEYNIFAFITPDPKVKNEPYILSFDQKDSTCYFGIRGYQS